MRFGWLTLALAFALAACRFDPSGIAGDDVVGGPTTPPIATPPERTTVRR